MVETTIWAPWVGFTGFDVMNHTSSFLLQYFTFYSAKSFQWLIKAYMICMPCFFSFLTTHAPVFGLCYGNAIFQNRCIAQSFTLCKSLLISSSHGNLPCQLIKITTLLTSLIPLLVSCVQLIFMSLNMFSYTL